jgi:hypothetical protein
MLMQRLKPGLQWLNRSIGMLSVISCATACVVMLSLMIWNKTTRESSLADWVTTYLWVVSPYLVLGILSWAARKNALQSTYLLTCVLIVSFTNQAILYLVQYPGGENGTGVAMACGLGPLFAWEELGVLLGLMLLIAVIVRITKGVGLRSK